MVVSLFDWFLHLDQYLAEAVQNLGYWIYFILFLVIFIETGVVFIPFLPGDSLLFSAGAIAAIGNMNFSILIILLTIAAIAGDNLNYYIGYWFGNKISLLESSKFFNKNAFDKANKFYNKYGSTAIIMGRFFPFIRTFVPFIAGMVKMSYTRFSIYNIVGSIIWVGSLLTSGYYLGSTYWLRIISMILIILPGISFLWIFLKKK